MICQHQLNLTIMRFSTLLTLIGILIISSTDSNAQTWTNISGNNALFKGAKKVSIDYDATNDIIYAALTDEGGAPILAKYENNIWTQLGGWIDNKVAGRLIMNVHPITKEPWVMFTWNGFHLWKWNGTSWEQPTQPTTSSVYQTDFAFNPITGSAHLVYENGSWNTSCIKQNPSTGTWGGCGLGIPSYSGGADNQTVEFDPITGDLYLGMEANALNFGAVCLVHDTATNAFSYVGNPPTFLEGKWTVDLAVQNSNNVFGMASAVDEDMEVKWFNNGSWKGLGTTLSTGPSSNADMVVNKNTGWPIAAYDDDDDRVKVKYYNSATETWTQVGDVEMHGGENTKYIDLVYDDVHDRLILAYAEDFTEDVFIKTITCFDESTVGLELVVEDAKCAGQPSGSITSTLLHGKEPISYVWTNSDTTASLQDVESDFYEVEATNADGCVTKFSGYIDEPDPIVIDTMVTKHPGGLYDIEVLDVSGGVPFYAFDWSDDGTGDFDDGSILSGVEGGAQYVLEVRDQNFCVEQITFDLVSFTNVEEEFDQLFRIYPNPSNESVNINYGNTKPEYIRLMDLQGRVIQEFDQLEFYSHHLDLSDVAKGTYLLEIKANSNVYQNRLLKR